MDNFTIALLAIAAIGISYAFISIVITNKVGNRGRVKEIQKRMNEIAKEQKAALDRKEDEKVSALGSEQMGLLKESMILQFKPLIFLLPFLFILPALAKMLYPTFAVNLPVSLPVFIQHFENFPNWRSEFGPVGWFWVSFLFASLIAQAVVGTIKKIKGHKGNKEKKTDAAAKAEAHAVGNGADAKAEGGVNSAEANAEAKADDGVKNADEAAVNAEGGVKNADAKENEAKVI